jgi:choline kinase
MAFKMKAGKEGPMKKNFGSAMNFNAGLRAASKAGKLDNNPKFKAAVDKAPMKAMKDKAPMMRMEKGAMKKMGKPAPVKAMGKSPMKDDGVKQGFKDLASNIIGKDASKERQKQDAQKQAFMANWNKMTDEEKAKVPNVVKKTYGV